MATKVLNGWDMQSTKITNLADGTVASDAAAFGQIQVPAHQFLEPSTTGWFWAGGTPGGASNAPTPGTLYFKPFWPSKACTLTQLAFEVTIQSIAAAGTDILYYGIYACRYTTVGQPWGAPIVSSSYDLESAAAGIKVDNIANTSLNPVPYWIAAGVLQTGVVTTAGRLRSGGCDIRTYGLAQQAIASPTAGMFNGTTNQNLALAFAGGALPTISTLTAFVAENAPSFAVELSS